MNKALSGQAEAKATRTRDWVSITRAPIFRRRRWIVSKSDRFNPAAFGMAERTARIIQQAMVWRISRIWLAVAGEQDVRSLFSRVLWILGTNGWKREGSPGYITHGGVGSRCPASGIDCTHVLYAESDTYAIAANKKQHRHE